MKKSWNFKVRWLLIFLVIIIMMVVIMIDIIYNLKRDRKISNIEPLKQLKITEKSNITMSEPNEIGELLVNPGKGLVLRDGLDNNYDDIIAVNYYRFEWREIEPEKEKYNWNIIDNKIEDCIQNGKKFAFGVINANSMSKNEYVTPKWVFDEGAKSYKYKTLLGVTQIVPKWNDKIFLKEVNNFILALSERYDGNENIAYIDIRSYGNYGEQHLINLGGRDTGIGGEDITPEQLLKLYINPYKNAFKKTLLVNPWGKTDYNKIYNQSIDNGVSIRRDGIMKLYNGLSSFEYAYGKLPTIFEYYRSYDELKRDDLWNEQRLINYINEWKPSYVEYWPKMYEDNPEFVKYIANKIGYYFKLNGAKYNSQNEVGKRFDIKMDFINDGVAPLYENCVVYIGLLDENYNLIKKYKTNINPQNWQPEKTTTEDINIILNDIYSGKYIVAVGLFLNENDEKPTYLLGNMGKTDDNWYVMGNVKIEKNIENEIIQDYLMLRQKYSTNKEFVENIDFLIQKLEKVSESELIANIEQIQELISMNYALIDSCIESELVEIVKDIDEIAKGYAELFELNSVNSVDGIDGLNAKIDNTNALLYYYKDRIELSDLEKLVVLAVEHYAEDSVIGYFQSENIIDIVDKIINKRIDEYNLKSVSIEYSTNTFTNQDVVAKLVSASEDIEMPYGDTYTFDKNGMFAFKYVYKGEERELVATVDWIDKTYPEFVGIDDRFDEMEPVTINVVDENLESVVATRDGQAIQFNNGDTLIEVGAYVVTATDKAGNMVVAEFRIVDYIESNKEYYIAPNGNGDGHSKNSPMNVSDASKIRYYAGDKILFKSGERYNIDLNWYMMGAMEKNVTISNYDDGDMPVINGSIELVSNLNISGIRFTNSSESCLITNQMYNENIAVFDCVFENIDDTAIFLNKQVSNININNCIFRNCGKSGIAIKNDDKSFIAQNVLIRDNMFIGMDNMIAISGDFADESFENVQVCDNYFVNQKGDNAIISFGSIVDTKFDVKLFNNFYYNFEAGYSADKRYMEALKNNLVSENNTWHAVKNSRILNESVEFEKLHNDYNIENNSKFVVMNPLGYQISLIEVIASDSYDKNEVIAYILETIRMSSENKKVEDIDVETGAVTVTSGYEAFLGSKVGSGAELTEKNSQEKIEDVTIAEVDIPLAGWKRIAFGIVAIALVGAIVSGVKNAKYWKEENRR